MRRTFLFAKRNFLEILRDPIVYIFCLGFPLVMIALFEAITYFAGESAQLTVFELPSLIPGIVMFSFSFVMLTESLLVAKDRTTAFLIRLYTSPIKSSEFVLGYAIPAFVIGVAQEIICMVFGWFFALIFRQTYFPLASACLLALAMLPILITMIFFGIFFGTVLNDKSAPGVTSVIISLSGILGGAWMPLDAMGGFEIFCRFLPFYPSVYIGRVITGAKHSVDYATMQAAIYSFDQTAVLGIVPIAVFLVLGIVLAVIAFTKGRYSDRK